MPRDYLIAIDPGTKESGVCIVRTEDYRPLWVSKLENSVLYEYTLEQMEKIGDDILDFELVIERMQGNGMSVSSDVFLTCEWIGRFDCLFEELLLKNTSYVYRREEYKDLCSNIYSRNDAGIRSALVDRFAYGMANFGKGNKQNPGWFYGFGKDMWSAYAIAVTHLDKVLEG